MQQLGIESVSHNIMMTLQSISAVYFKIRKSTFITINLVLTD